MDEAIPGIDDDIRFNGGFTVAGEDFIESLGDQQNCQMMFIQFMVQFLK